eukprot:6689872-Ditylum_brightwellii.AAC.1
MGAQVVGKGPELCPLLRSRDDGTCVCCRIRFGQRLTIKEDPVVWDGAHGAMHLMKRKTVFCRCIVVFGYIIRVFGYIIDGGNGIIVRSAVLVLRTSGTLLNAVSRRLTIPTGEIFCDAIEAWDCHSGVGETS